MATKAASPGLNNQLNGDFRQPKLFSLQIRPKNKNIFIKTEIIFF